MSAPSTAGLVTQVTAVPRPLQSDATDHAAITRANGHPLDRVVGTVA